MVSQSKGNENGFWISLLMDLTDSMQITPISKMVFWGRHILTQNVQTLVNMFLLITESIKKIYIF